MGSARWMVGPGINLDQGQLHNQTKQLNKLLKVGRQFIHQRFQVESCRFLSFLLEEAENDGDNGKNLRYCVTVAAQPP